MGLLRNKGFLAAVATSTIVALYFVLVADRAIVFMGTNDPVARALGFALLLFPMLGAWWLFHEWRVGTTVQRMADELEDQGRLPIHDGEQDARGRLTGEAQDAVFEVARRGVDLRPDDWAAWFHVAYAYEAAGTGRWHASHFGTRQGSTGRAVPSNARASLPTPMRESR